jgi:phosphatidylserine/phosphatidylglycerophosphate/cardiolipin synthase-like enzyme
MKARKLYLVAALILGLALWMLVVGVLQAQTVERAAAVAVALAPQAAPLDVVVSEIAWMGTTVAWQDEWIELYNNTAADVDLEGWRLVTGDGSPDVALDGTIPAGGHFLLERTDDTSADPLADQIYTGNLNNGGEVVTLTDALSDVIDVVGLPGEGWFAGDNDTKQTMVRVVLTVGGTVSTSWATGVVSGTPTNSIVDGDLDTYGFSPNLDWTAGTGPGYEAQGEDCDDADAEIHPGAAEVFDYVDNNCDGQIDEGFVLGAFDYAVYFNSDTTIPAMGTSSDPTSMEQALIGFIDAATQTVDCALYGFDRESVRDALIAAHNRGLTVRVVADDEAATGTYAQTYDALTAAGIPVVTDPYVSYLQHNKFAVFDRRVVWTGSTNWTDTGFSYNANSSIVVTSPHLALAYTAEFEEMYVDGRFAHQKTDNTQHVFTYTNALVELYFSPSDGVEARVADVISAAQDSLHFAMFYWTSDPLGTLVYTKVVTGGLDVWGVWDAVGAANQYSEDELLCSAGVPLKVETFGGKVHHKFGVVDVYGVNPVLIVGSYNWTAAGAFDNDENTLIIRDAPAIAAAYYTEALGLYDALPAATICGHHSAESGLAACGDGVDNDYDSYVDENDWDCGESTVWACTDGIDNDGDGYVDLDDFDCDRLQSIFLPLALRNHQG